MQTDLSDGVAALAAQGTIDPKRACIVGVSYGGYAALAGVTLQQGLYRCAVSVAGLSDLAYLSNETAYENGQDARNVGSRYLKKFLGAAWGQSGALAERSPAKFADRADAPILLVHGTDDTVVPIGQSREMESALKKAGKPVEFLLLPGQDHWLSEEATRKSMLAAVIGFVQRHNPAQ
jgi:dipeptidyl aminopeptidase/acylaminoacyl peptidase